MKVGEIVYPTICDPLTQLLTLNNIDDIRREIKIQALFFEEGVSPSVSHILTSGKTWHVLKDEPELLEEGIIKPLFPRGYGNIDEYIEWRDIDWDREFIQKWGITLSKQSIKSLYLNQDKLNSLSDLKDRNPKRILRERIEFLEKHLKQSINYNQIATREIVKASLLKDLDVKKSIFRDQFKRFDEIKKLTSLVTKMLDEKGVLHRYLIFLYMSMNKISDRYLLQRIINLNYFSTGSLVIEGTLESNETYIPLLAKKCNSILPGEAKYLLARKGFSSLLHYLHIDSAAILNLDVDSLKNLRKAQCTRRLREVLWNFANKWYEGYLSNNDINDTKIKLKELESEINAAIRNEAIQQRKLYKWTKKPVKILERVRLIGTTLTLLGLRTTPWLGIIGMTQLVAEPILKYIADRKANFIVFAEKLTNKR